MSATRAFYVIQGSLQIRDHKVASADNLLQFPDSDDGLRAFDNYLKHNATETSIVLIDVIEEVFSTDSVPKLGRGDRRALLDRRVRRKFPRTPYRLSVCGRSGLLAGGDCPVVHSAVTNHELLDPWLSIMLRHRVPLTGVFSVPLMATKFLGRFYKSLEQALFITHHQGDKLRQSFVQDGLVKSARVATRCPLVQANPAARLCVSARAMAWSARAGESRGRSRFRPRPSRRISARSAARCAGVV